MKRLTTNDTNHILALLNMFYAEDNEVMVRVAAARNLIMQIQHWWS